jgi:hypothetical protein
MSDSWDNLDLTPRKDIEKDIDCNKNLLSQTNLNINSVAKLQIRVEDNNRPENGNGNINAFQFVTNSVNSINSINSINSMNSSEEEHFIDEDEVEQLLSDVHMHENNTKTKEKEKEKEKEIKPIRQIEQKDENEKKPHIEPIGHSEESELIEKSVINNEQETSEDSGSNKYKNYFKNTFYNMRERVTNAYNATRNKILEYQFPNKIKEIFDQNKYQILYFMIGSVIVGLNISIMYNQYKMLNDRVSSLEREMCYRQYRQCECYFYVIHK